VHIPDGFLDAKTCATTFALAGGGLALALRKVRENWHERAAPLHGVLAAFIFVGQLVNFPVVGGTSGHLFGGILAAVFLGPYGAALIVSLVLIVQCFLFQDGGVMALGANLLNMSFVGVFGGYAAYKCCRCFARGKTGLLFAIAVASWTSINLAASACSFELAVSHQLPFLRIAAPMLVVHAIVGLAEAAITLGIVSSVLRLRPELLECPQPRSPRLQVRWGLGIAFALVLCLLPFASALPEMLDKLAVQLDLTTGDSKLFDAPFANYIVPGIEMSWASLLLAAMIGSAGVLLISWFLTRIFAGQESASQTQAD